MKNILLKEGSLEKAKRWAEDAWMNAVKSWAQRPAQDYEYRKRIIEPVLAKLIAGLKIHPFSSVVEFGCGDGTHSLFWRSQLNRMSLENVKILGIDFLAPLIAAARINSEGYENILFDVADVTVEQTAKTIQDQVGIPDVIVAMFLFQDLADLEGLLKTIKACLGNGGHLIAVFVNPDFAEHLLERGHIKRLSDNHLPDQFLSNSGIVQWRFIGFYPIVQTDSPPFYLPYFHRSLSDYFESFQKFDLKIIDNIPLMIDPSTVRKLQQERIMPFIENNWNVYWPLIIEEPSSVLIHAIKE